MLKSKSFVLVVAVATVIMLGENTFPKITGKTPSSKGSVNWEIGVIRATGYGVRPQRLSNYPAKARLMAREAAIADAYRSMARIISEVRVDGDTYVKEHEGENDEIRASVHGFIKGAYIISEADLPDGSYEIIIELPLYGENGLTKAILPKLKTSSEETIDTETNDSGSLPLVPNDWKDEDLNLFDDKLEKSTESSISVHTGLIIDARSTGLQPCMSPKILFPDGSEVWGTVDVSPEFLNKEGLVIYAKDMGNAMRNNRVGKNPLVIKALDKAGKVAGDVVVSEVAGKKILKENVYGKFLDNFAVVFLIDK